MSPFQIHSQSIHDNQMIDDRFTHYFDNQMPDITWTDLPTDTKDLLLICYDPDALKLAGKVWIHLLVTNMHDEPMYLKNDLGTLKYEGPRPPPNTGVHHYHYKLYALNCELDLDASKRYRYTDIMELLQDKVIAESEIVGLYEIEPSRVPVPPPKQKPASC